MNVTLKLDFSNCDDDEEINSSMVTINSDASDHDHNVEMDLGLNNSVNNYYGTDRDNRNDGASPGVIFSPRKEYNQNHSESPPYKRIRALRLFDSPATPKTLLQKCAADSTSANKPTQSHRLRSRYLKSRTSNVEKDACKSSNESFTEPATPKPNSNSKVLPIANINPFTPSGMLLSRKRTRSRRDLDKSNTTSEVTFVSDSTTPTSMGMEMTHDLASTHSVVEQSTQEEGAIDYNDNVDNNEHSDDDSSQPSKRLSIYEANVYRYHEEFVELSISGRGQFGSVYKCRHRLDGCIYAIKKSLKPVAGSANERIALNEVYAHAVLGKHPHVVRYYSAWAENNHMIIQNEYCNGGSLADVIESNKKTHNTFSESQLRQILLHIAKGLKYIHSQQLVHMDIKPGNIFISREPLFSSQGEDSADDGFEDEQETDEAEDVVYKIGDLGHVTSVVNPQVEEGDCRYLPREILQEDFSQLAKADIFALGLTIYECSTGEPLPLNGEEWHSLRDGSIPNLPQLSPDLQMLLRLMTHPDPRERPTALQLVQQLTCNSINKSHAQLRRELNAEKLKNEILSRQLLEAAKCLQSISPNVTSSLTAAVVTGVLAGVAAPNQPPTKGGVRTHCARSGPTTRNANSRIIGKKVNRSISTTNF